MYPSQNAVEKANPGMCCTRRNIYMKKNGNQHAMNEPMINPRIRVALFSFFRAIRFFSRSGSLGFCMRGTTCSTIGSQLLPTCPVWSDLLRFFAVRLPNIGLQKRIFNGFTTAQRDTTPESELLGSNSLTMSMSIPTDGWRARASAAACCWSSPLTESVDPRNVHCDSGFRTTWGAEYTWNKIRFESSKLHNCFLWCLFRIPHEFGQQVSLFCSDHSRDDDELLQNKKRKTFQAFT